MVAEKAQPKVSEVDSLVRYCDRPRGYGVQIRPPGDRSSSYQVTRAQFSAPADPWPQFGQWCCSFLKASLHLATLHFDRQVKNQKRRLHPVVLKLSLSLLPGFLIVAQVWTGSFKLGTGFGSGKLPPVMPLLEDSQGLFVHRWLLRNLQHIHQSPRAFAKTVICHTTWATSKSRGALACWCLLALVLVRVCLGSIEARLRVISGLA